MALSCRRTSGNRLHRTLRSDDIKSPPCYGLWRMLWVSSSRPCPPSPVWMRTPEAQESTRVRRVSAGTRGARLGVWPQPSLGRGGGFDFQESRWGRQSLWVPARAGSGPLGGGVS
ncbi:hypothetical protein P7K49_032497 [Saguinus oedipus]|uniref:Uncharacterized protein n=1 Tax=Saguinus oedipus TaxID=9490 RepID=A0ABQ9TYG2_SAGOE|nr:hypothetical protein P7K49_032497 [Saguinus oedipus]